MSPPYDGIIKEDIEQWRSLEITRMFFDYLKEHAEYEFHNLRGHLDGNELDQAALTNAGLRMIEEIQNIPEEMIEFVEDKNSKS